MNNQGEVVLAWGDGEHCFKLAVTGLLELEEKCNAAFAVIFTRVNEGAFSVSDISETIRLGLIGGGKSPVEAKKLVDRYILPLAESAPIARLILLAVMFGFEASPVGKTEATPSPESMNGSTPPPSSATPGLSELDRMSLAEFHTGNWWQS